MKQNITNEQFKELTFKQSIKLLKIMGIAIADSDENRNFYNSNQDLICKRYQFYIDHVTIGKMIEILINNVPKTNCVEDSIDFEYDRVTKMGYVEYRKTNFHFAEYKNKELCDALWQAVKELL